MGVWKEEQGRMEGRGWDFGRVIGWNRREGEVRYYWGFTFFYFNGFFHLDISIPQVELQASRLGVS